MELTVIALLVLGIYPYLIYPLLVLIFLGIKRLLSPFFEKKEFEKMEELPPITLLITAYNEELFVRDKISNTLKLNYPPEKLNVIWVTDGSTDATPAIISEYPQFTLLHSPERKGKIHAMQRAIGHVDTELIVFCDANTILSADALIHIAEAFRNPAVGCIAGRKVVLSEAIDTAAPAGESFYWQFESSLKWAESKLHTAVGAVGELFAIRRSLFNPIPDDTLLDDMQISLNIVRKGYKIAYVPEAWAAEYGSANVKEEMKRKIRIATGGFQLVRRNGWLFNIIKYPLTAFLFISHKFMRWAVTPVLMYLLPAVTAIALILDSSNQWLQLFLLLQLLFFTITLIGYLLQNRQLKSKALFFAYYFFMTNWAQIVGFARFMTGKNNVKWERSERIKKSNNHG